MSFPPVSLHLIFALAILCLSVFLITAALLVIFFRFLLVAVSLDGTSSGSIPLLRDGGLAIVAGFIIGILLIHLLGDHAPIKTPYFLAFLASLLLIVVGSFYADIMTRGHTVKPIVVLIATAMVLGGGITMDELYFPSFGKVELGWWGFPLSLLWILGLTKAFTLTDRLDGMAACTAVIGSGFFSFITFQQGSLFIYLASLVLCAASLGFLIFNWPPAKIIMGEIGSAFLGFSLAVMAVIAARYDHSHTSMLVVPLLFLHVIFDTALTSVRHLWRGEKVPFSHRTHLYQLLNQLGYSHRSVVALYSGMAVLQGLGAIWMVQIAGGSRVYVFLPFLITQAAFSAWILGRAGERGLI